MLELNQSDNHLFWPFFLRCVVLTETKKQNKNDKTCSKAGPILAEINSIDAQEGPIGNRDTAFFLIFITYFPINLELAL